MNGSTLSPHQLIALYEGDLVARQIRAFLRGKPHVVGTYQFSIVTNWEITVRCRKCYGLRFLELKHEDLRQWAAGTNPFNIWPADSKRMLLMEGVEDDCHFREL